MLNQASVLKSTMSGGEITQQNPRTDFRIDAQGYLGP
jgi:hypothetical protein